MVSILRLSADVYAGVYLGLSHALMALQTAVVAVAHTDVEGRVYYLLPCPNSVMPTEQVRDTKGARATMAIDGRCGPCHTGEIVLGLLSLPTIG